MLGRTLRAQSAMEYLMTYGWAILIIAVVLGALFSLGVFGGSNLLGTSCIATPGYSCSNPIMNTNGQLSFTLGQNTGSSLYNIALACAATSTSLGFPSASGGSVNWGGNTPGFNAVNVVGYPAPASTSSNTLANVALSSGQTIGITNWPCYGTTGVALAPPQNIGAAFSGYVWLNYTTTNCQQVGGGTSGPGSSGCPWLTAKILTVTVKVT